MIPNRAIIQNTAAEALLSMPTRSAIVQASSVSVCCRVANTVGLYIS